MNPRRADRRRSPTGVKIHARYGVLCRFCSLLELTAGSSLYLSLNSEAQTADKHTKMPRRAVESKEEKNEKRGEKVIKISGRHPRGQTSKRAAAAAARPHQYENEPAVTATAVRLPWHLGCLEEVQPQGRLWACTCWKYGSGLPTSLF